MIVARGFGRGGYSTMIPSAGLGRWRGAFGGGGGSLSFRPPTKLPRGMAAQDERDLAEILPALFGVLNGNS